MISRLLQVGRTYWRIGPASITRVAAYRIACRSGWYRLRLPSAASEEDAVFFAPSALPEPPAITESSRRAILARADALLDGELEYFSRHPEKAGAPPDWLYDPFSGYRVAGYGHWSGLKEFSSTADIKIIWEASRFEWVPLLARAWRLTGDGRYLAALNAWIGDWVRNNPLNVGPNWKCGQEAAIRCLNLLLGARLLDTQKEPAPALTVLIAAHCSRIRPSIGYAIGQDNNHGTSEAAALFVAGAWLAAATDCAPLRKNGARWREQGGRFLEDRVGTLIGGDGSFSQYSVNYHRVLLDTLSQVELWRGDLGERPFSAGYLAKCRAALLWLQAVTDGETGGAPNVGANDGARLYDLSCSGYRDFRPSVQLASALFEGRRAYADKGCDEPLLWLDLSIAEATARPPAEAVLHREGGDLVLKDGASFAMLRFANYRFRPGHADCLHLDLWHRGKNVLRDGGTYSYNTEPRWLDYFSGTASHNTVQFDGRNQMPRLGRFLFGEWLQMDECTGIREEAGGICWSGAYTDWMGARHRRTVGVARGKWSVVDEIEGHREKAVLRWRLMPGAWRLDGGRLSSEVAVISVSSSAPVCRMELVTGWESLYYQEKTELPVLEVEVGSGRFVIETEISLN